jgi:hypothetical protein
MKITVAKGSVFEAPTDLLVLPIFGTGEFKAETLKSLDEVFLKRAAKTAAALEFSGKAGQSLLLPRCSA